MKTSHFTYLIIVSIAGLSLIPVLFPDPYPKTQSTAEIAMAAPGAGCKASDAQCK